RRYGGRPAERATTRVVAERHGDAPREARHRVPGGIERGHLHRGTDDRARHGVGGLRRERELRCRPRGDVEWRARDRREPAAAGRQRVTGGRLVEAQVVEGGHPTNRRGPVAREAWYRVPLGIERADLQRRRERGAGGDRRGLDGELELRRGPGRDVERRAGRRREPSTGRAGGQGVARARLVEAEIVEDGDAV